MSRRTSAALTCAALSLVMITGAVPAQAGEDAKPPRLRDYQPRFQAAPDPGGDMFRYPTTTKYWSVVSISPLSATDLDLRLYGDKGEDELLGTSVLGTGVADFLAVDSNHRDLDRYFPRVDYVSGDTGAYDIQLSQGSQTLGAAAQEVDMTDNEIAAVRDTYLEAGKTYRFVLSPGSSLMDADLFLMGSLPLTPETWVQSRSQAVKATFGSPGAPVIMQITAPRSDWYGLVIVRTGFAGTWDLTRTVL
jgi:hypothetical protein